MKSLREILKTVKRVKISISETQGSAGYAPVAGFIKVAEPRKPTASTTPDKTPQFSGLLQYSSRADLCSPIPHPFYDEKACNGSKDITNSDFMPERWCLTVFPNVEE